MSSAPKLVELQTVGDGLQFVVTVNDETFTSPVIMKEPYTQEQIDDALGLILVSIDPMWRPMVKSQAADAIKNLNITEDETV